MSTITTRASKGSPLSWTEADANFTNLNTDKLEASDLAVYLTSATAASTYETQAHASSTYETQSHASTTYPTKANNLSDLASASTARTNLGLGSAATQASTAFATSGAVTTNGSTMATGKLLGRTTATTGAIEEITVGSGLSLSAGTLSATNTASLTLGTAQNSTSGTSIDFTGIPSTAKRIMISLSGVSTNGSSNLQIQLGSGSVDASGYIGAADNQSSGGGSTTSFTTGLGLLRTTASNIQMQGIVTFTHLGSNVWVGTWVGSTIGTVTIAFGSTTKTLSGALDRIRLTTTGSDTFDAGSVNIMYE